MYKNWSVVIAKRVIKEIESLPKSIRLRLQTLLKEIEIAGPVRGNWPNYSKLSNVKHHCHIKDACWEVADKEIRLIEVYYVGTREKAPY